MTDTVQLVPSVPVISRPAPVRPDQHVEPAKETQSEKRSADNGNDKGQQAGQFARHHLTISRTDKLGTFVYRSIEEESGDVVWQYPTENRLRMSQHLQQIEEQSAPHQLDEKA